MPDRTPTPTEPPRGLPDPAGEMIVDHFDVGQADATLIKAPDATILIDAGDWQRNDVMPHLQAAGISYIDLFILTNPHAKHIGQVPQVLLTGRPMQSLLNLLLTLIAGTLCHRHRRVPESHSCGRYLILRWTLTPRIVARQHDGHCYLAWTLRRPFSTRQKHQPDLGAGVADPACGPGK
jgi:hypothetical protein